MNEYKTSRPSLKKNFLLSTAYQILLILAPTITAPYVARVLETDGVGTYSYTNSYVMFFSLFATLGTLGYGAREISRNRKDKEKYSLLFWEIELLTVITTFICLIFWTIWIIINVKYRVIYLILTFTLIASLFDISWFYSGLEQFQNIVFFNGLFKILSVIAVFVFVNKKNDLYIYTLILSLSTMLGNLGMWINLPQYLSKINFKNIKIKRHFKETLIYFVPTIATSIYTLLDKTLIGIITKDSYENGYYEQATKIANMAKSLTFAALNSVMGARISFLFAEEKYDEIRSRIENSIDYILFMGIGIMCGLLAVSARFIPLFFGDGYDKTITLLKLMSPIILIIGISNCLGWQYYSPAGLRATSAKFIIIGSIVNLILNLILIPSMESYGATIASIIAELTITILYLKYCNGFLKVKYLIKESYKKFLSGLIMIMEIYAIDKIINNDFIAVSIEVVSGIILYVMILYFLKDKFVRAYSNKALNRIRKQLNY